MEKSPIQPGISPENIPWNQYPRPQMVRDAWLCLNGAWKLTSEGRTSDIMVPFCPESPLSKMTWVPEYGKEMVYERSFTIPGTWAGKRILLHFGAVSRLADVYVNGNFVCHHEESYYSFSADITDALIPGENTLTVRVVNDVSHRHPWGKQKIDRGGMWYTPVSGIWQTVWLEPVPEQYIRSLSVRIERDRVLIRAEGIGEGTLLIEAGIHLDRETGFIVLQNGFGFLRRLQFLLQNLFLLVERKFTITQQVSVFVQYRQDALHLFVAPTDNPIVIQAVAAQNDEGCDDENEYHDDDVGLGQRISLGIAVRDCQ